MPRLSIILMYLIVVGIQELQCQFLCHSTSRSLPCTYNEPLYTQKLLSVRMKTHRDLYMNSHMYIMKSTKLQTLGADIGTLQELCTQSALHFLSCSHLCTVCPLISVVRFMQHSHLLPDLRQILFGFSLGSKHMFIRFTHFQLRWYNSLTLWAYLPRRHDNSQT